MTKVNRAGRWSLVRRVAVFLLTVLFASVIVFALMRLLPGDAADLIPGDVVTSPEVKEALREQLGLNDPLAVQYGRWLGSLLTGDFGGESLISGQPIGDMISRQFPVTLLLTLYAVILSAVVSVPLGIGAALKRNRWPDFLARFLSLPGQVLPNFWLALLALLGLVLLFRWSPPLVYSHPWDNLGNHIQMVAIPLLLLTWEYGSHLLRVTRASVLSVMAEDYITAARAHGLSEPQIVTRHALRASAMPIITVMGLQFSVLIGGVMILESIFGLPGLGRGLVDAALARDFPVVQTYVTLLVILVLMVNLVIDLLYRVIDPRLASSPAMSGSFAR